MGDLRVFSDVAVGRFEPWFELWFEVRREQGQRLEAMVSMAGAVAERNLCAGQVQAVIELRGVGIEHPAAEP